MGQLPQPFNVAQTDISQSEVTVVPGGNYVVILYSSEVKPTKEKNGGYVEAKYRITQGEYAGSALRPDVINVYNQSATAARIGAARLGAIATACGKGNEVITNTDVLHNIEFMVTVTEKDNSYTRINKESGVTEQVNNKQNEITTILMRDGSIPKKPANAGPQTAPGQPPQMAPQPQQMPPQGGFQQPPQGQQPAPAQQPAGAPAWAGNVGMGQGLPPGQAAPAQQPQMPQQNWGAPPAGAWGGPQQ